MWDADLEQGASCSPGAAGSLERHCSPTDGLKPQYVVFNLQLAKSLPRLGRGKWHRVCACLGVRNGRSGLADGQTGSRSLGSPRLWDPVARTVVSLSTRDLHHVPCAGVREDEEDEAPGRCGAECCVPCQACAAQHLQRWWGGMRGESLKYGFTSEVMVREQRVVECGDGGIPAGS